MRPKWIHSNEYWTDAILLKILFFDKSLLFYFYFYFLFSVQILFYLIPNNHRKWVVFCMYARGSVYWLMYLLKLNHISMVVMNESASEIAEKPNFKISVFSKAYSLQNVVYYRSIMCISATTQAKFKQMIKQQCYFANISKCRRKMNVDCVRLMYVSGCFWAFGHFVNVPAWIYTYTKTSNKTGE